MEDRRDIRRPPTISWWPLWLVVGTGLPLWLTSNGLLAVPAWARALLLMLFATAVAAFIVGDIFRFVWWWFFTRR